MPVEAMDKLIQQPYPWRTVYWCHIANGPWIPDTRVEPGKDTAPFKCGYCEWVTDLKIQRRENRTPLFFLPDSFFIMHSVRASMNSHHITVYVDDPNKVEFATGPRRGRDGDIGLASNQEPMAGLEDA